MGEKASFKVLDSDGLWIGAALVGAALGAAVGRSLPQPYLHQSVDWIFYSACSVITMVLLRNTAANKRLPAGRSLLFGAVGASALGVAGQFFGWNTYDTVFAVWAGWLGGASFGIAPISAAVCLGLGAITALLDLLLGPHHGGISRGFGPFIREGAYAGFFLLLLLITFEWRHGKKLPWRL